MNGHEMLPLVGKLNSTISTTTQNTATQAIGRDQRPRLHVRWSIQPWVVAPRKMTTPYAAYRKIVLMAVTMTIAIPPPPGPPAAPTANAATVNSHDTSTMPASALAGVR